MRLSDRLLVTGSDPPSELIDNINRKHQLLAAGDDAHRSIHTALIIGAGAMRGVYAGGVVTALEQLGFRETFDEVIGVSAGAATEAYFLAGQAAMGTTIYYEELASKDFINPAKTRNMLNVAYLEEVFTQRKPLDLATIQVGRSNFYIGVTNIAEAKAEYIQANHTTDQDIIKLIQASSSVPGVTSPLMIGETLYGDGISTCKNPIRFAIESLGCTDILYVTNQPLRRKGSISLLEKLLSRLATSGYSDEFKSAFLDRHTMSDETGDTVYPPSINIGVLCPPKVTVSRLTRNSQKLKEIAEKATRQTLNLF